MNFNVKPSKPAALLGVVVGIGMIGFALTHIHHHLSFMIIWCVFVLLIVGMNVWAAFAKNGATGVIAERKKQP